MCAVSFVCGWYAVHHGYVRWYVGTRVATWRSAKGSRGAGWAQRRLQVRIVRVVLIVVHVKSPVHAIMHHDGRLPNELPRWFFCHVFVARANLLCSVAGISKIRKQFPSHKKNIHVFMARCCIVLHTRYLFMYGDRNMGRLTRGVSPLRGLRYYHSMRFWRGVHW